MIGFKEFQVACSTSQMVVRWKTLVHMRGTSSSFDWFTVRSTFVETGHSNCFGVGYTILGKLL